MIFANNAKATPLTAVCVFIGIVAPVVFAAAYASLSLDATTTRYGSALLAIAALLGAAIAVCKASSDSADALKCAFLALFGLAVASHALLSLTQGGILMAILASVTYYAFAYFGVLSISESILLSLRYED